MTIHSVTPREYRTAGVFATTFFFLFVICDRANAQNTDSTLFDDSAVHEIQITIDPTDMELLRNSPETLYYRGEMTIDGADITGAGLRQKGHGSRNPYKPGLKVKFGEFGSASTFQGLRGFGLKSNVTDASQIKQRVAIKVFEQAGIVSPRQSSARVYINGQDQGLYTIEEDVDKVFLKRVFRENEGNLYEVQGSPSYYFEDFGNDRTPYVPTHFEPKSPENPDNTALMRFISAINYSSDKEFQDEVGSYLDWRQFLT